MASGFSRNKCLPAAAAASARGACPSGATTIDTAVDHIKFAEGLEKVGSVMDRGTLVRTHVLGDLGSILHTRHQYHWHTGYEPPHSSSPTDHVLSELQLYGYRPFQDEPDPRPLPEAQTVATAVADIFNALAATLSDTRVEPDWPSPITPARQIAWRRSAYTAIRREARSRISAAAQAH